MFYPSRDWQRNWYDTLLGTNLSPCKGTFKNDFPFPQAGYVSSLEGNYISDNLQSSPMTDVAADDDANIQHYDLRGGRSLHGGRWAEVPEDRGLSIGWMFFVSPKHNKKGLCSGVCWCYIFLGLFLRVYIWRDCRDFKEKFLNSLLRHDLRSGKRFARSILGEDFPSSSSEIYHLHQAFCKKMKKICQHFSPWQP